MIIINDKIPIYSIFILILILTAGYCDIFPCKIKRVLSENIYIKHFFTFLTMIFFVVLVESDENKKLNNILSNSLILYIIFIFVIKTEYRFFISIIFLLGITYIFRLKKDEINKNKKESINDDEKKKLDSELNFIAEINNFIFIIVIILIIIGFLIYLGEKKLEYKNKFNFLVFLFGKTQCSNYDSNISIYKALKHSLS